jgi:hypothetical protein
MEPLYIEAFRRGLQHVHRDRMGDYELKEHIIMLSEEEIEEDKDYILDLLETTDDERFEMLSGDSSPILHPFFVRGG